MQKLVLTGWQKFSVLSFCFVLTLIGFMIKLPASFRHIDKELHAGFYFLAAAVLNLFFAGTNLIRHVVIFITLYLFGMAIEAAQEYSNRFFRKRIHGRFDLEDLQGNLTGLIAFSLLWFLVVAAIRISRKTGLNNKIDA